VPAPRSARPRRPATTTATRPRPTWIQPGAVALDAATARVGQVQHIGPLFAFAPAPKKERDKVWLRPVGGGVEWESTAGDLAPAATGLQGAA
jgi:hypothetical protein